MQFFQYLNEVVYNLLQSLTSQCNNYFNDHLYMINLFSKNYTKFKF